MLTGTEKRYNVLADEIMEFNVDVKNKQVIIEKIGLQKQEKDNRIE